MARADGKIVEGDGIQEINGRHSLEKKKNINVGFVLDPFAD